MDEEVEDIVGDVKYTDSQKSMTTSAVYSQDFTDSSSDKNTSSGKETYIITCDSDDSAKTFHLHQNESVLNFMDATGIQFSQDKDVYNHIHAIDQAVCTSLPKCNIVAQEIFTQTSKTIMELAQNDTLMYKPTDTLETQTSFVSISENKTVEYTIQVIETKNKYNDKKVIIPEEQLCKIIQNIHQNKAQEVKNIPDESSTQSSHMEKLNTTSDEEIIYFIEDDSKLDLLHNKTNVQYDSTDFDSSKYDSEMEDDSLEKVYQRKDDADEDNSDISEIPNSVDNDVKDLYNKLTESPNLLSPILTPEPIVRNLTILTPLTEETGHKKDNIELSPSVQTLTQHTDDDTIFINNGVRVTMLPDENKVTDENKFKLPSIFNQSSFNNPPLNYLFSTNSPKGSGRNKEGYTDKFYDRWELGTKELASGESPLITGRNDSNKSSKNFRLPPIQLEGYFCHVTSNRTNLFPSNLGKPINQPFDVISIDGKIKELKISTRKSRIPRYESRSCSPTSTSASPSPDESRVSEATERGCETLCCELLRKLRSSSWVEVNETLEDLPKTLSKFWPVISETRIADLLRRVTLHIESPRTQVARAACSTLAEILKNTNYTKKPDFYEGIASLLIKTGSYNRPLRRAANVALDDIVSHVDVTHTVTAICIYGVGHKNSLVRSASARLLVVCCALAEGGRQILRARPPTAAAARKHTLMAMAELLQDKSTDTRKYAERLYAMLRPLNSFEAYFLTDVDVELATRHMKKYDLLLINKDAS